MSPGRDLYSTNTYTDSQSEGERNKDINTICVKHVCIVTAYLSSLYLGCARALLSLEVGQGAGAPGWHLTSPNTPNKRVGVHMTHHTTTV